MSDGEILFEVARGDDNALVIALREFNGKAFVDARIKFKGQDGRWYPTKKGITIRPAEIQDVAAALNRALDQLAKEDGR